MGQIRIQSILTIVGKNKVIARSVHFNFTTWILITLTVSAPHQPHTVPQPTTAHMHKHGFLTNQPKRAMWVYKETEGGREGGERP